MKKCRLLGFLLTAALLLGGLALPEAALAAPSDISGHWAEGTVSNYISRGIMSGYPDGTFKPNAQVTRTEFVKMVNSVFGYNTAAAISFPDVSTSYWGYQDIARGVMAGYINGDETGRFRPEDPLTREEAAVIIAKIKGLTGNASAAASYTDYGRISSWALPAVGAVSHAGYMNGGGDGAFNPKTPLTRAEAATVLAKAETKNTTYTPSTSSSSSNTSSNLLNSNTLHKDSYGTSSTTSSTRVTDYTLGSNETTLRNKTITGNLYIPSSLSNKSIRLEDLTVNGTVYVRGGGTITVDDCDFADVVLDYSGVTFKTTGSCVIDDLRFWRNATIQGKGYRDVTIEDESVRTATVNATVNNLVHDCDANLRLGKSADIDTLEVTSRADGCTVYIPSGAYVDEMEIYDGIDITGSGEINRMQVYSSGVYSSIKPNKVTTSGSGKKPTYTDRDDDDDDDDNSGSSSNNGSTNRPGVTNPSQQTLTVTGNTDGSGATYKSATIQNAGAALSNATISGDLTIAASVGDGAVTLSNVTVKGQVYVEGGGQNSVIFTGCDLQGNIYAKKERTETNQPVAIKLNNSTKLAGSIIVSGDALLSASPNDITVKEVKVNGALKDALVVNLNVKSLNMDKSCNISMNGQIDNININSNNAITITMEEAKIGTLASAASVVAKGNGLIDSIVDTDNWKLEENVKLANFKAVTEITGVPESIVKGVETSLNGAAVNKGASNTAIVWSIVDDGGTGAKINENKLTASQTGEIVLLATVKNGLDVGIDYTHEFTVPVTNPFVAVTSITPAADLPKYIMWDGEAIELSATVAPTDATNQTVRWTVDKPEYASVSTTEDGKVMLTPHAPGTIKLTPSVEGGSGSGRVFTGKTPVIMDVYKSVTGIEDLPKTTVIVGQELELTGTVEPTDASKRQITWKLTDAGETGAEIATSRVNGVSVTKLTKISKPGTIKLTAEISGGITPNEAYTKDLVITAKNANISDIETTVKGIENSLNNIYLIGQQTTLQMADTVDPELKKQLKWEVNTVNLIEDPVTTFNEEDGSLLVDMSGLELNKVSANNGYGTIKVRATMPDGQYRDIELKVKPFTPVKSITVDGPTWVLPSESAQFTTTIAPEATTYSEIEWSVTGGSNATNMTPEGRLDVSSDEPDGRILKVTATIKNGAISDDYTELVDIVGERTVTVKRPEITSSLKVDQDPLGDKLGANGSFLAGQKLSFTVEKLDKDYFSKLAWEISTPDSSNIAKIVETKDNYAIVQLSSDITAENTSISVVAKVGSVKAECPITIIPFKSATDDNLIIGAESSSVAKGGTTNLTYRITDDVTVKMVNWTIGNETSNSNTKVEPKDNEALLSIAANETATKITVTATLPNAKLVIGTDDNGKPHNELQSISKSIEIKITEPAATAANTPATLSLDDDEMPAWLKNSSSTNGSKTDSSSTSGSSTSSSKTDSSSTSSTNSTNSGSSSNKTISSTTIKADDDEQPSSNVRKIKKTIIRAD